MEELNRLKKSSERSAIISLIGLVIFFSSLLYSSINLDKTAKILDEKAKDYKKTKGKLDSITNILTIERQRIDSLKEDELQLNEYLIRLLNSTQANQGNPEKQNRKINWDTIKKTITELRSGRRKLAVTIALLTTWKAIPFKMGINTPKEGFDSSGYIEYILKQLGITIKRKDGEKLSEAIMRTFQKVNNPLPGDLIFYHAKGKDEVGNFGLFYLCRDSKIGQGVGIGTLDTPDSLNIYETSEVTQPTAFIGYFRVPY
jgi:cell wall-associated NlpC family hydrolase